MAENALNAGVFLLGLIILWAGAQVLVRGSVDLALSLKVRPLVVGLTVVAFGTSMPEAVVSIIAALAGSPEVAIGNVVGSNIANLGLIVGMCALILPLPSDRSFLKKDMPVLFGAMALLYGISWDGTLGRPDGAAFLFALCGFLLSVYRSAADRGDSASVEGMEKEKKRLGRFLSALAVVGGLIALTLGARLMVLSAVKMARAMGVSEAVIGATIVAVGTSLPELATSLAAVIKKQPDIGLGNVIGSNILNLCFILGIAPLLRPVPVSRRLLMFDYSVMTAITVVFLLMLVKRTNRLSRAEGFLLLSAYIAYVAVSFVRG